jgi:nucleoside-diphosphate kinase
LTLRDAHAHEIYYGFIFVDAAWPRASSAVHQAGVRVASRRSRGRLAVTGHRRYKPPQSRRRNTEETPRNTRRHKRRNDETTGSKDFPMAIERTFSILKPDATARNLTGAINAMIEAAGLRIIAQKRVRITREQAETFYAVHRERPFFGELVEFMVSGPVVVQVLEGDNAIVRHRDVMGATDPAKAAAGTIRKVHARSIGENSVHGSDAADTAAKEIAQFFSGNEIVG